MSQGKWDRFPADSREDRAKRVVIRGPTWESFKGSSSPVYWDKEEDKETPVYIKKRRWRMGDPDN